MYIATRLAPRREKRRRARAAQLAHHVCEMLSKAQRERRFLHTYISTAYTIRKRILYVPVAHCLWPSRASTHLAVRSRRACAPSGWSRARRTGSPGTMQHGPCMACVPSASPTLFRGAPHLMRFGTDVCTSHTLVCTAVALSACTLVPPHFKPLAAIAGLVPKESLALHSRLHAGGRATRHGEHQVSIMAVGRALGCRVRGRRWFDGRAQCHAAWAMAMAVGRPPAGGRCRRARGEQARFVYVTCMSAPFLPLSDNKNNEGLGYDSL